MLVLIKCLKDSIPNIVKCYLCLSVFFSSVYIEGPYIYVRYSCISFSVSVY